MSMCEFHNHSCVCCLEHHIEEAKRCKVDNLPIETGICHTPCSNGDYEVVKED